MKNLNKGDVEAIKQHLDAGVGAKEQPGGATPSLVAIFEHADEQHIWYGDRPCIDTQCNGRQCSVIGVDRELAASWKSNSRQLTVIGARDLKEVTDLVAHLQDTAG